MPGEIELDSGDATIFEEMSKVIANLKSRNEYLERCLEDTHKTLTSLRNNLQAVSEKGTR